MVNFSCFFIIVGCVVQVSNACSDGIRFLHFKILSIKVKMGGMCGIKLEVVRNKDFHMVHVAHNICGS